MKCIPARAAWDNAAATRGFVRGFVMRRSARQGNGGHGGLYLPGPVAVHWKPVAAVAKAAFPPVGKRYCKHQSTCVLKPNVKLGD